MPQGLEENEWTRDPGSREGYNRHDLTHRHRLKLMERQRLALHLRKAGATYRDIARQVSRHIEERYGEPCLRSGRVYCERAAHEDVQAAIKRIERHLAESAKDVFVLQHERINAMIATLWPSAMGRPPRLGVDDQGRTVVEDPGTLPDTKAIAEIRKLLEREAKLFGLDAPESFVIHQRSEEKVTVEILRGVSMDDL